MTLRCCCSAGSSAAQRQDALLEPLRQRQVARLGAVGELIEDERRGFGAVADDGVALVEQPGVEPGGGERPVAESTRTAAAASAAGR